MGPIEFFDPFSEGNLPVRTSPQRRSRVTTSPKGLSAELPVRSHGRERERQQLLRDLAALAASSEGKNSQDTGPKP
ncbi:hypothetical protein [Arthrobacter sp. DR-2P]|nr:hypothetical protein [Arthrobacter sp. DR-2P]